MTVVQAQDIQQQLRQEVIASDQLHTVRYVAGVDVGFCYSQRLARASAVILHYPDLQLVESAVAIAPINFPYIPGYLSFRELPVALLALERLNMPVDLILCDGQGFAHPRRFGLACHLGVTINIPTIGVAKSCLLGSYTTLPRARYSWVPLLDNAETIGAVARTREGTRPLFISIGHKVDLQAAIKWTFNCLTRYRLPETTRAADHLAKWTKRVSKRKTPKACQTIS